MSIFERAGSRGNSTICLPRGVSVPVLSSAPRIHSWYIEFRILSWGGGGKDVIKKVSSKYLVREKGESDLQKEKVRVRRVE